MSLLLPLNRCLYPGYSTLWAVFKMSNKETRPLLEICSNERFKVRYQSNSIDLTNLIVYKVIVSMYLWALPFAIIFFMVVVIQFNKYSSKTGISCFFSAGANMGKVLELFKVNLILKNDNKHFIITFII